MTVVGVAFLVVGLIFVVLAPHTLVRDLRRSRRAATWQPAQALVEGVRQERRSTSGTDGGSSSHTVRLMTYAWADASGRRFTEETQIDDDDIVEPGRPVQIFVDPDDPSRSQFGRPTAVSYGCGVVMLLFLLVLGLGLAGIGWMLLGV